MCHEVEDLIGATNVKVVRHGFVLYTKFPSPEQAQQIEEFQQQMLDSRWPMDEAEL